MPAAQGHAEAGDAPFPGGKMRLVLLGTGGPRQHPARVSQSSLLETATERILIDAGCGAVNRLSQLGIEVGDVDRVLLTHHHYDHIGDLGVLLLGSWWSGSRTAVDIVGPPGTRAIVDALIDGVYAPDIRWRQAEHRVRAAIMGETGDHSLVDPADFIRVREIVAGTVPAGADLKITAAETEHGRALLALDDWRSVAYRVETGGNSIAFSGDAAFSDELVDVARGADVLVLNCYASEREIRTDWDRTFSRTTIASSRECGRIAAAAGVRKLVLSHLGVRMTFDSVVADVREHYSGPVVIGSDLLELAVQPMPADGPQTVQP